MNTYYRSHVDDRTTTLTKQDRRASMNEVEGLSLIHISLQVNAYFGDAVAQTTYLDLDKVLYKGRDR